MLIHFILFYFAESTKQRYQIYKKIQAHAERIIYTSELENAYFHL